MLVVNKKNSFLFLPKPFFFIELASAKAATDSPTLVPCNQTIVPSGRNFFEIPYLSLSLYLSSLPFF